MRFDHTLIRVGLYGVLILFSFILFCLSIARLNFTNRNGSFYDPIVVELLVTTLFTIPWSAFILFSIFKRFEHPYVAIFAAEIAGLIFLWVFWLAGAAGSSNQWGTLSWCQRSEACRVLSALIAFSWLGWLTVTVILGLVVLFSFANSAFREPLHGKWDPRQSFAGKA